MGKKAFTLVELLVVIAVIALLMSILLPTLRKAKDQAMRASCANNIRQILTGVMMYADENRNQLPRYPRGWLWDIDRDIVTEIMEAMGLRTEGVCETAAELNAKGKDAPAPKVFYCPANSGHRRYMQYFWDYHHPSGAFAGYRLLGYFFLFGWPGNGPQILPDGEEEDYKTWVNRMDVKNPSSVELITDVTLSDVDAYPNNEYPNGNFASIISGSGQGGYTGQTDTTSHLKNDREGAGGNIGFVDGSVFWRPFNKTKWRYKPGSGPVHWW